MGGSIAAMTRFGRPSGAALSKCLIPSSSAEMKNSQKMLKPLLDHGGMERNLLIINVV